MSAVEKAKPVKVEIQNAEHAQIILRDGTAIIEASAKAAEKYYDLIMDIRKFKIEPSLVRVELGKLGFKKSRISELNRICAAPEKVFRDYEAKLVGFDRALELARIIDGKAAPTAAAALLIEKGDSGINSEVVKEAVNHTSPSVPPSKKKPSEIIKNAAEIIGKHMKNGVKTFYTNGKEVRIEVSSTDKKLTK